jgi:ABC-type antimicrobial peptide transport system permease subunit
MKNDKISKESTENTKSQNFKNKITSKHLTHLDNFIQQCLDKFKFIDPKQEFYDATGDEKDLIISHKSTIPDLVIWNKKFNKNDCFEESNTKKMNPFPRFQFYLRIKSNKPDKDKKKEKKNEKEKNNQNNKAKKEKEKKNKKSKIKRIITTMVMVIIIITIVIIVIIIILIVQVLIIMLLTQMKITII